MKRYILLFIIFVLCNFSLFASDFDQFNNLISQMKESNRFIEKIKKTEEDQKYLIIDGYKNIKTSSEFSIYILDMIEKCEDESLKESLEDIYKDSLEENSKISKGISKKIIRDLINGNNFSSDYLFEYFNSLNKNNQSGFYYVVKDLIEGLENNRRTSSYLSEFKEMLSYIHNIELERGWIGENLKKLNERFGKHVVNTKREAIDYILENPEHIQEYNKKIKRIDKAFSIYDKINHRLNKFFGREISEYEKIFEDASMEESSGNYKTAIDLYQQVITINYSYATNNGCFYHIASCYQKLNDINNSLSYYKESIIKDITVPYKRYSYETGLSMFLSDSSNIENLKKAVSFLDDVLLIAKDQYILQSLREDKANLYFQQFPKIAGLTEDQKEEYYNLAIISFKDYIENFMEVEEIEGQLKVYKAKLNIASCFSLIASLKNELSEKEKYFDLCISQIETVIVENSDINIKIEAQEFLISKLNDYAFIYKPIKEEFNKKMNIYEKLIQIAEPLSENSNIQIKKNALTSLAQVYFYKGFDNIQNDGDYQSYAKQDFLKSIEYYNRCLEYSDDFSRSINYYMISNNYYNLITLEADEELKNKYINKSETVNSNILQDSSPYSAYFKYMGYIGMSNLYLKSEDYELSIEYSQKLIDEYSANYYLKSFIDLAKINKGECFVNKGDYNQAINYLADIKNSVSNQTKVTKLIADSYFKLEDFDNALIYYKKVMDYALLAGEETSYQESLLKQVEINTINKNYAESMELIKELSGKYSDTGYYYKDRVVEKTGEFIKKILKVKINPIIEEMEEGETKRLVANLTFLDGTGIDISGFENIRWSWDIKGNQDTSFEIKPLYENANSADFTLIKGNFMDVIVTAKLDFTIPELNTRTVSRDFQIKGENQVPIMIVNEDDERIQDIPMINPHNLEGIGMGESPYASDPVHASFKFLGEYKDNSIDEIEMILLDPFMSLSHHVVLTETEEDSRIFRTKIPEVNLDDDPENNVAYDSFEIKINYPFPYPQIMEAGTRKQERGISEKAELEFLKKNGEVINDFDQDGEIQDKEKIVFPIWQGPDYEENDIKPYYISNMTYRKEDVKSLDQTQFIAKNSKFYIKVLSKNIRNEDEIQYIILKNREYVQRFLLRKYNESFYKTEPIFSVFNIYSKDKLYLNDHEYDIFKIENNDFNDNIEVKYSEKNINIKLKKMFFMASAMTYPGNDIVYKKYNFFAFEKIRKILEEKMNYTVIFEESLTKEEFLSVIPYCEGLFYFGHGRSTDDFVNINDAFDFVGIQIQNDNPLIIDEKNLTLFTEEIPEINFDYKFIFMNCCRGSLEPGAYNIINALNPEIYISYKDKAMWAGANTMPYLFIKALTEGYTPYDIKDGRYRETFIKLFEDDDFKNIYSSMIYNFETLFINRGENEYFKK